MRQVLFCPPYQQNVNNTSEQTSRKRSSIYRFFKWFYLLIINHWKFFNHLYTVWSISPQFIYERSSYLNYNGILISKWLKIPHFYEVNGILAEDNAVYYPRFCNRIALTLERYFCAQSFGFYVGGINVELRIPNKSARKIQNGIEQEFGHQFFNRCNVVRNKLEIAFVGHAMDHHKLGLLQEAFTRVKDLSRFRLHLIGTHLEYLKHQLPESLEVVLHGSLTQDQISEVLKSVNVGVIPFTKDYYSHVKLFMYGAAKLAVILPRSRNYDELFEETDVAFITNDDAGSLSEKLEYLSERSDLMVQLGENIYNKIMDFYTWEKIFDAISLTIMEKIVHRENIGSFENSAHT